MQNKLLKNKPSNCHSIGYRPIGVMDSGVGGISVLNHIRRLLPHESLSYVADSRYAPYGSLSSEEITKRCFAIADFLIAQDVKALVVACNTATAASIQCMREKYTLPIIGMEPAVKPAALASKNGVIGVLATVGTLKSAQYAALLENHGNGVSVLAQGCEGLVECVERGELVQSSTRELLEKFITPLLDGGADTIVLGCTHYPFLRPLIESIVGAKVAVIDTGKAVSTQLQKKLSEQLLMATEESSAEVIFWTNSPNTQAVTVIQALYGDQTTVKQLLV
ncbi:MAG: glutamate racemase [Methylophilaceae bacterium]